MNNVYLIILCGGFGERLWPITRRDKPKPFVPFINDKSLIEQTLDRIKNLNLDKQNIGIVINKDQKAHIESTIGDNIGFIIEEKESRNTAPAVLLAALNIYKKDPNAVVVFLPADSFIVEDDKYVAVLSIAIKYAQKNNKILTVGVMPTKASTSYGYIQAKNLFEKTIQANCVYEVEKFHEKPDIKIAESYLKNSLMLWNISVFVSNVNFLINEFKIYAPTIYYQMLDYLAGKISYLDIESKSIDFAVIEKSKNIAVIPADFTWCDVGNVDIFLDLQSKLSKENINIINISANNNLASLTNKNKIVAFVGVSDLCLVDTQDVLLIVKKNEVEKIKELLSVIKKSDYQKIL